MKAKGLSALLGTLLICVASSGCFGARNQQLSADRFLDDKVTAQRVREALSTNFPNVQVTVTNGTAVLTGSVPTPKQKSDLDAALQGIERVKGVHDQVRVASGTATNAPTARQ